jgi:hypothetical protein
MSDYVSKLPEFVATRSTEFPKFLIVWCPRDDCVSSDKRPFLVAEAEWMRPYRRTDQKGKPFDVFGRACPYCFRASKLPPRRKLRK